MATVTIGVMPTKPTLSSCPGFLLGAGLCRPALAHPEAGLRPLEFILGQNCSVAPRAVCQAPPLQAGENAHCPLGFGSAGSWGVLAVVTPGQTSRACSIEATLGFGWLRLV